MILHTYCFISHRLPQFTEEEKKMMKGTADYFGLNHYTSTMCGANDPVANESAVDWNYWSDPEIHKYRNASWLAGKLSLTYMFKGGHVTLFFYPVIHYCM